jgi:hypothetical protein
MRYLALTPNLAYGIPRVPILISSVIPMQIMLDAR